MVGRNLHRSSFDSLHMFRPVLCSYSVQTCSPRQAFVFTSKTNRRQPDDFSRYLKSTSSLLKGKGKHLLVSFVFRE